MLRPLSLLLLLTAPQVHADERVVASLSQSHVSITTSFSGSKILIFGAVKRETAIDGSAPLEVVVTVSGPAEPVTVRRKERVAGLWVNVDAVEVDLAPSFYAVSTTGPLGDVLSSTEDLRNDISIDNAIRSVGAPFDVEDSAAFTEALIRIREADGLYFVDEGGVDLRESTLFSTEIALPANLVEGDYATRIFLIRGGDVVTDYETAIDVRKVGLERWLYELAHVRPLLYGLLSLFIAISAGWLASAVFRYFRY